MKFAMWQFRNFGLPAVVLLVGLEAFAARAADTEWPSYNNGLDGQRYSTLAGINAGNVKSLAQICSLKIADAGAFQAGPLVIGGVIYVTAATTTVALDAKDCGEKWRADYTPTGPVSVPVNRGVAFLDGKLFRGTVDGKLLAMDAAGGKVLWMVTVTDATKGESLTSAPIAWNGRIFIGTGGGDLGIKGKMLAFDAATGKEVWRFNTIPTGNEPGAETWEAKDTALTGGGGMWSSYTLDTETGELFIPVGNPAPALNQAYRPGKNLYTDSLVVLDAQTGALKWYYQLKSPDSVDHDLGAAPVLYKDSKGRQIVAMAGKDGYAYGVDRATHRLLFRTATTTIKNEGIAPTPEGFMVCPGLSGGTKWNGPAFDPNLKSLFVPATDWCNMLKLGTPTYVAGKPFWGGSFEFDKTPGAATGWINALDSDTGKIRWRYHTMTVTGAAVTPTAGGIVFTGDADGDFLALDSKTGKLLLKTAMTGPLAGGIVTYAIDGRQYVAFTTGNISRSAAELAGTPTLVIMALSDGAHPAVAQTGKVTEVAQVARRPGDAARGKALYSQTCITCHGSDGTMLPNFSLKDIKNRKERPALAQWIKNPKPPMPRLFPSPFSAQDVEDIAAYVEGL
jgi:alcohol dehydrogenase (cytochrome c)